jgi:hypothetical protein
LLRYFVLRPVSELPELLMPEKMNDEHPIGLGIARMNENLGWVGWKLCWHGCKIVGRWMTQKNRCKIFFGHKRPIAKKCELIIYCFQWLSGWMKTWVERGWRPCWHGCKFLVGWTTN